MEKKSLYIKLFKSTFFLSMFTFGGGYVIVPLMEKKFVNELGWISEDEMLDLIALGQSAPGPIAVNTSILVGYRMAGVPGASVGAGGHPGILAEKRGPGRFTGAAGRQPGRPGSPISYPAAQICLSTTPQPARGPGIYPLPFGIRPEGPPGKYRDFPQLPG